jgi:hypothetical protein
MARSRVELFEQIRRDRRVGGLSVRELAENRHVHRRTVRQALASAVPPPRKAYARRTRPAIDAYVEVIDSWLLAGRDVPRKQRHTARRVWQRLVAEHGATCAEVTVSRDVACRRVELGLGPGAGRGAADPSAGRGGRADFGEFYATIAGPLVTAWMFVMRLSHCRQGVPCRIGYPGAGGFSWKGTYWRSSTSARCQPTVATSSNL